MRRRSRTGAVDALRGPASRVMAHRFPMTILRAGCSSDGRRLREVGLRRANSHQGADDPPRHAAHSQIDLTAFRRYLSEQPMPDFGRKPTHQPSSWQPLRFCGVSCQSKPVTPTEAGTWSCLPDSKCCVFSNSRRMMLRPPGKTAARGRRDRPAGRQRRHRQWPRQRLQRRRLPTWP